ncbi:MAG: hypothetical protein J6C79_03730 [Clostridia bacterium]|nr:hypothetical protein [Clostridia bacterium]
MDKIRRIFIGFLSMFILFSVSACGGETYNSGIDSSDSFSSESSEDSHSQSAENSESDSIESEDSSSVEDESSTEEENKQTYVLTFKLNENDTGTKIVIELGDKLSVGDTRIPSLPACDEIGYHYSWDKDFWTLTESDIVTAVKKAKTYTVYLDAKGGELSVSRITVTFGEKPNLPTPTETKEAKGFMGWYYGKTKINADKAWSIDQEGITLNAVWSEGSSWTGDYS